MKQKPKTFLLALVDNEWYVAFSKNKTFRVAAETLWWGRLSDSIWTGLIIHKSFLWNVKKKDKTWVIFIISFVYKNLLHLIMTLRLASK